NCDAIHFFPIEGRPDHGVLCVNNEYTDYARMFADYRAGRAYVQEHPQVVGVSQEAQGVSVVEVRRERGRWKFVKDSRFNRRITANSPIDIGGPARGSSLLKTKADPAGARAFGTMA